MINLAPKEFLKALQTGSAFAGKNRALPIYDCVKLKFKNGKLSVVSTNGDSVIKKTVQIEDSTYNAEICVAARDFISYIKAVKSDIVSLDIIEEEKTIKVKHAKGESSFPLMDASVFPQISPDSDYKKLTMDAVLLNNWIAKGIGFVANDELRPVMNNLYVYLEKGELGCCASDGMKLMTDSIKVQDNGENINFLVNKAIMQPLCNAIAKIDEVEIRIGDNNTMYMAGDTVLLTKNITGRYPNFRSVIPSSHNYDAKVSKDDTLDAMSRCLLSANQASGLAKLEFNGMELVITCQDIDFSRLGTEKLFCTCNGQVTIGFKGSFLVECINSIGTSDIVMELTDKSRAMVLREDNPESKLIVLLMPMMLND